MDEKKLIDSRKYFIFKIRDLVNNSFHTLEEKRMESLLQYMEICISTYDELRTSLDQTKLKRSYEGLLEGLDYQMQMHPFHKLDLYRNDFSHLHQLIILGNESRDKEIHNIHRGIVALKKKLQTENLIDCYILCLTTENTFKGMDCLMEALVSDLLYMGHSMTHIFDFFKKQQQEFVEHNDTEKIIQNLKKLDKKCVPFSIHISFKISSATQMGQAIELIKRQFQVHTNQEAGIPPKFIIKDSLIATKEYMALDEIKAVDMARKEFQSVIELFDMWQGTKNCIRDDLWYFWQEKSYYHRISLNSINNAKMLNYIDINYKKQMERFLQLRNGMGNENTRTLERVLYTLNSAKSFTVQNRFLNFWSSLEYILHPFPRFTIIEKARVVVPEVFGLFYLKNKMNIFWARLTYCMEKKGYSEKYPTLQSFVTDCQDKKDYSTPKMISYLCSDEKYNEILSELSFHIVLERECRELIMLLTEPAKANKAIQEYFDSIKHDLNYIYRLRNQLIHSAKDIDESLEYISFRLYRYVNSVLSTILYYEEKNSLYNITDILGSIDATYQDYSAKCSEDSKKKRNNSSDTPKKNVSTTEIYRIVRPKYLFIE